MRVTNDLLMAADGGFLSILVLLDLSAAFDTISHNILMNRLCAICVFGIPLAWFTSYLSNRTQYVQLKSFHSQPSPVSCGIPRSQGKTFPSVFHSLSFRVLPGLLILSPDRLLPALLTPPAYWLSSLSAACPDPLLCLCLRICLIYVALDTTV